MSSTKSIPKNSNDILQKKDITQYCPNGKIQRPEDYFPPYHINIPSTALTPGQQSNEVSRPYHNILVQDIRGRERDFTLDRNGFVVLSDQSSNKPRDERERPSTCLLYEQYNNQDSIRRVYRNAVENWLKAQLGAEEVAVFTHEVRRRASTFPEHPRGKRGLPQPVQGVHGDFTGNWALERMRMHFGDEKVSEITKRRWQVLNIWRPLFGPLEDWPLAVCDFESLEPDEDLVASDNVYPHMMVLFVEDATA
ncbi:MAG: hypothetical protein Q9217_006019 [Psora testacea]